MKLDYVRFVKQARVDQAPLTQWVATQKLCLSQLLSASVPWKESSVATSSMPINNPATNSPDEKFDAFKISMTTVGSSEQACAMGCACYRFKVPQDAKDNDKFFRSISVALASDKFNVGGCRLMFWFGDKLVTESWSEFMDRTFLASYPAGGAVSGLQLTPDSSDAKGAFGVLASRTDYISAAANASDVFTFSATPSVDAEYLFVFVGLYDYEAIRVNATGKQTREYWIEGSASLVGTMSDVAFSGPVVPDDEYSVEVEKKLIFSGDSDFSDVMVRPLVTEVRGEETVVSMPLEAFQASFYMPGDATGIYHFDHYPDATEQRGVFARLQMHVLANLKNVERNPNGCFAQHALNEADADYANQIQTLGLCSAFILFSHGIAPAPIVIYPSIFATVMILPFSLNYAARKMSIRNSGALSLSLAGAKVTLTAWLISESVARTQSHLRSYTFVRALAGDVGFWRGDVETITRTDETLAFGAVEVTARRLCTIDLPDTIAIGAEIDADVSIDRGERGYIVLVPNVYDVSGAPIDVSGVAVEDNQWDYAVGLGREYMPVASGPSTYDVDYTRSDFSRVSGLNEPSANIGWKPKIYLI